MRNPEREGSLRRDVAVAAAVALCAVAVMTWPLAKQLGSHFPGHPRFTDTPIYLWDFWWYGTQIGHWFPHPLACDAILFPFGAQLAYHVNALYYAVIGAPLAWAFGVLPAFNLVLMSTFVTSAAATYVLARMIGLDRPSALLAALLFSFSPYRLQRFLTHANMLKGDLVACYVIALLYVLRSGKRWRPGIMIGLIMSLAFYASLESPVYLGLISAVFVLCMARPWRSLGESVAIVRGLALGAFLTALCTMPYLAAFFQQRASGDYYVEAAHPGAGLSSFVTPPGSSFLWSHVVAGLRPSPECQEGTVFLGLLPVCLAGLGCLFRAPGRELRFVKVLLAVFFVFSLGPALHFAGEAPWLPLPMHWLRAWPVLSEMRLPERFHEVTTLPFALMAGWGFMRVTGSARLARWRGVLGLACTAIALLEYGGRPIETYRAVTAPFAAVKQDPAEVAVLDARANLNYGPLNQLWHGKPIVGGAISRVAPDFRAYEAATPLIAQYNAPYSLQGPAIEEFVARPDAARLAREVAELLGLRYAVLNIAGDQAKKSLIDLLPNTRVGAEGTVEVYRLEVPEPPGLMPRALEIGTGAWSAYLAHGWGQWARFPETIAGRQVIWPQSPKATVLFRSVRPEALHITFEAVSRAESTGVRLSAAVNGHSVGETDVPPGGHRFEFDVPSGWVRAGLNEVSFAWPGSDQDRVFVAASDCSQFAGSHLWPWRQGGMFVNGQNVCATAPGLNVVVFAADGRSVRSIETWSPDSDASAWARLAAHLDAIPEDREVTILGCQQSPGVLPEPVKQALAPFGANTWPAWRNFAALGRRGAMMAAGTDGPLLVWPPGRCGFASFQFATVSGAAATGLRRTPLP